MTSLRVVAVVGLGTVLAGSVLVALPDRSALAQPATSASASRPATTWRVGPTRELTAPSQAASRARDGDTVLIDAGTYSGDVATWPQDDLTLRGVGGRVRLPAAGRNAQGKAIWVISGDRVRVEAITFTGATVPDGNGAGIRSEGAGLTVVRSRFLGNQNGILTSANAASNIVVRRSRFVGNGAGDGYSHNLYVGAVRSLTVTGSWFGGARVGHQLKSRAQRATIVGNRFDDRSSTASYSIDLPNGGTSLVAGNEIIQGPASQNPALLSYGAEGLSNPGRTLWVVGNTFVNQRSTGTYVVTAPGTTAAVRNNLLRGPGVLLAGPGSTRGNQRVTASVFVNRTLVPRRGTRPVNRGVAVPRRYRPTLEYVGTARQQARRDRGRMDVGAHAAR